MAELHWFPFFSKDWLSSPARMAMTPAQRGAYIDLLAFAWGNGDTEPCLDPSPEILSGLSGLGRDWKRLSPLVLAQFDERDGLLYNAKLSSVWRESQERHESAVIRGKKGGRPRKAQLRPSLSPAKAAANQSESESQETVKTPTEFLPVSPADAPALDARRSPDHREMDANGTSAKPTTITDVMRQLFPNRRSLRAGNA